MERRDDGWRGPGLVVEIEPRRSDWDLNNCYDYQVYWVLMPDGSKESFLDKELRVA